MSTTTSNLGLIKPELTDAADITAMNNNWDLIDSKLKEHDDALETAGENEYLPLSGGKITGNLEIEKANSPGIVLGTTTNNGYTEMYQHNGMFIVSSAMSSNGDKSSMILSDPVENDTSGLLELTEEANGVSKRYKVYGEHNKPTPADIGALSSDTITYSTEDIGVGSPLQTGRLYIVYE